MAEPRESVANRKSLNRQGSSKPDDHPEDQAGAAKATEDNDLTTGHSQEGDGGDANSKKAG